MTVAAATELWRMSAVELAEVIRSRRASSHEVIESHLGRIESVNPAINAVVIVMAVRAAYEIIAGPTWRDPWTVPVALDGPKRTGRIGVALVLDPGGSGTAEQVQDGVRIAGHALADAGYAIDLLEPPGIDAAANALLVMDSAPGVRAAWEQVLAVSAPRDLQRFVAAFFEAAADPDAVAVEQSYITRLALAQAWGEFQELHPLIVAPIATDIPRIAGTDLDEGQVAVDIRTMRMAMAVNALGLPAVAVPVGVEDDLSQVVQVIGPRYREDLCLDAAQAIEDRVGILTPIDPR